MQRTELDVLIKTGAGVVMLMDSINDHGPGGFTLAIADREKCKITAYEPKGGDLGSLAAPWWEELLSKSTVRTPLQIKGMLAIRRKFSTSQDYTVKLLAEGIDQAVWFTAILCLFLSPAISPLSAAPNDGHSPHLSARELVKEVARNEERARKNPRNYYKFVQQETTPKGSKTSIRIETSEGEIGEVVSVNGKPPSKEQCRAETQYLTKLAAASHVQQQRSREQETNTDRIDKLIAAVPDAFIFEYQGRQNDSKWIEIRFRPNKQFQPQSHEALVLEGMRGTLWVDPASHRLAKIDGRLFKDVEFGWGFLASLRRGGHFAMQQSEVPGGSWKQTFLEVDFDGSKLVFGNLHVQFKDQSHSFARLAGPPSLAEAVDMLEHAPTACRKGRDQSATAQAQIR